MFSVHFPPGTVQQLFESPANRIGGGMILLQIFCFLGLSRQIKLTSYLARIWVLFFGTMSNTCNLSYLSTFLFVVRGHYCCGTNKSHWHLNEVYPMGEAD